MLFEIDRVLNSVEQGVSDLPTFPPKEVQELFVGRSGRLALQEVVPFLSLIAEFSSITSNTTILDFGVGWGRIARFFQGIVPAKQLYLADIDQGALDWCKKCGVQGTRILLEKSGPLPLEASHLNVVYSYSVFSHLSEAAAILWLNEIHRTLKSDGILVFTTQSLRFLHLVKACAEKENASDLERSIGRYMGSTPERSVATYERGEHTYSDVNGSGGGGVLTGDFYGWAAIPPAWFERNFGSKFMIEKYVDDPEILEQAIYIVRKR
ncbi:methyltransferase family protein [Phyllobacterium myrsinacearum]|uniref:class I SAM-dependent methyltransferase n=1 Tax=Phyllobacterium myrsinacearum TaxID=28101 RepID=UPI001029C3ED|nr:class I SAM-dependent methyltransferase [Phyllobacterium myrsinacearum]RZS77606.1 methyltransferase family protein [Phyllobacterium myrsinacearum]